MRRREFLSLVGGAATWWPLVAHAQHAGGMPVVGFIDSSSSDRYQPFVTAFRGGLAEFGFVEGQDVAIEYRWAEGRYDQLPGLAADLVRRNVAVIAATGVTATRAAMSSTATIPIVFNTGGDPVKFGLVSSLNRPGGNVTGVASLGKVLVAKQFELLQEFVPSADTFGFMVNPNNAVAELDTSDTQAAARTLGHKLLVLKAGTERDIDAAFPRAVEEGVRGLIVQTDPFLLTQRNQLVALAARYRIPAVYYLRDFVAAGGLMSYGTSLRDALRLVGRYAGRILKGEKPAELPVQQSVKVELVVNLKTAKALGLEPPTSILLRADELIE